MTALEFTRAGVTFRHVNGRPTYDAPEDVRDQLLAEVARRAATILAEPPRGTHRWGACEVCGDPMAPHRGGMCELCVAARRSALRSRGLIP